MNHAQKLDAFYVLFMVVFALLSLALPAQWPLTIWISNMNIYACMTLAIIILSFFKGEMTSKPIVTIIALDSSVSGSQILGCDRFSGRLNEIDKLSDRWPQQAFTS